MATELLLEIKLLSDATFGRGDGVAGLIDAEVEHDECGLPYLRGRTIKGLLVEECANLLYALGTHPALGRLEKTAEQMFGSPGSAAAEMGMLKVGAGTLPENFREAVADAVKSGKLTEEEILTAMTAIRRQTAVSAKTGAPLKNSLRSMRVVLRETVFTAPLTLEDGVEFDAEIGCALLAACVAGLRRGGTGRNRGRGRFACRLLDSQGNELRNCFADFRRIVQSARPEEGATV